MSTETLIEQRVSAVEAAIADIQRRLPPQQLTPNWLDQVIGTFRDEPAFDEVIAYGCEFRAADSPPEDDES